MNWKAIICCLSYLRLLMESTIFSLVIAIATFSSKDPFKSHVIGDLSKYFKFAPASSNQNESICICNYTTYEHPCTEENILEGCLNYFPNMVNFKPFVERKLVSSSFCTDMQESFARNEGQKLDYIFNLKYQTIRKISIAFIIVTLSATVLAIINLCLACKMSDGKENRGCEFVFSLITILILLAWIGQFVLFIILIRFIESGDIGKYDDFLECKNVNAEFFEQFNDIKKLREIYISFIVLNIISQSLDRILDFFEKTIVVPNESQINDSNIGKINSPTSVNINN